MNNCTIKLNATRDDSKISVNFKPFQQENSQNLKEIYMLKAPFTVDMINDINQFRFEELSKTATLALIDLNDKDSLFYRLVYLPFVNNEDTEENWIKFALQFLEKIFEAHIPNFYGGHGKLWAAYTFIDGYQVYFKFTAPEEVICDSLGDINFKTLNDFAMPYYYKEFANWSSKLAKHPGVKAWDYFTVSLD